MSTAPGTRATGTAPGTRATDAAPLPVVIDTDPGIDDAMAILAAVADPGIALLGLTTVFGNVPVGIATRNALQIVELAGATVPVAGGAARPLAREPAPHPDFVHGPQGLGEAVLPAPAARPDPREAARFLAETAAGHRGRLVVVAVGPLTNLALALERHPSIAEDVRAVVVMGGAFRHAGNVTPQAEANFWQDPDAAERVLAAPWPVTMVGLDVTETVRLYGEDIEAMPDRSPRCGAFLRDAFAFYAGFHGRTRGFEGCYLHDPVAVLAAADPGLIETLDAPVTVETAGEALGRSRRATEGARPAADATEGARPPIGATEKARPGVRVAVSADAPAIRRRLLDALHSGALP
jgi:inosine-uridine nucleoside N-ribohydrolase